MQFLLLHRHLDKRFKNQGVESVKGQRSYDFLWSKCAVLEIGRKSTFQSLEFELQKRIFGIINKISRISLDTTYKQNKYQDKYR